MKKLLIIITICLAVQTAHALPVNLSLLDGVSAVADSIYSNRIPENAIDGNYSTKWNAGSYWYNGDNLMHWLTIDLGNIYEINKFILYTVNSLYSTFSGYNIIYNFFSSTDNINWDQVGTGMLIDSHTTEYMNSIEVGTLFAQYLKFDVVGGTHWSHLNEIEIWGEMNLGGDMNSDPVPESATVFLMGIGLLGLVGYRQREIHKRL